MPASIDMPVRHTMPRRFSRSGFLLGFALSGFFDGILLHQVLQWHHLLSLVDSLAVQDIRTQILADGLFHLLMYLIAMAGLILLWKTRCAFAMRGAGQRLLAWALAGFGAWNVIDAVVFHWVLRLHWIRVEAAEPIWWDLGWFAVFGLAFVAAGWGMLRAARREERDACGPGPASKADKRGNAGKAALVTLIVSGAAITAALPPARMPFHLVAFVPGATPLQISRAFDAVDGRVLWADRSGSVWAIRLGEGKSAAMLYRYGALPLNGAVLPFGCLGWIRT